jgi:hypothetical protein
MIAKLKDLMGLVREATIAILSADHLRQPRK